MTQLNIAFLLLALMIVACNTQTRNQSRQDTDFKDYAYYGDPNYLTTAMEYDKVDQKPEVLHKEYPHYPDLARRNWIQGKVIVQCVLDESGNVIYAETIKPVTGLNEVSIEALLKSTFKPAIHNGKPVKVIWDIPYDFRLN